MVIRDKKILLIGAGGREHAMAWKMAQSPRVAEVVVAPGNPGTASEPRCRNAPIAVDDIAGLLDLARRESVALTVIGPELPLSLGIVDAFEEAGLRIFGPTRDAAQLESSKAFSKDFLARHKIPTAEYRVFSELESALVYIDQRPAPIVIKADGLAAGKGVVVATTLEQARSAARDMLGGASFGKAGARIVVEEFLAGEEASFIVVAGGTQYLALATSQDHKRIFDGDLGPNTGGMGAVSPAPVVTSAVHERVCREVIEPTLRAMQDEGRSFTGFLYAGLMIDANGAIKVLEFNTRMGDPETQPILFRLESDLVELLDAALDQRLDRIDVRWSERPALGVVLAAAGYPGGVQIGDAISGLDQDLRPAKVFHAGTAQKGDSVVTAGGRVLCVVADGESLVAASRTAYAAVRKISWTGMQYRRDIGFRALHR